MHNEVRVRQVSKSKSRRNPISGHGWTEETLLQKWEVVGPLGVISTHRSFEAAEREAKEWQAFYDKYNP